MKDKSTTAGAAVATAEDRHPSLSPTSSASSGPYSPPPVLSPCAACKMLRRRCAEKCVLAPYFPPAEPLKFAIAHRVFGASNIIKLLQELPEDQRADAVNSMVYEANARLRDPIYGCAGAISHLQAQISALQAELATAQAQILNMQCQNAELADKICSPSTQNVEDNLSLPYNNEHSNLFFDEAQAQILNMQCQNAELADKICSPSTQNVEDNLSLPYNNEHSNLFFDEGNWGISWGSLWT